MKKTTIPNFSLTEASIIQCRQLIHWSKILKPAAWLMLEAECIRHNSLLTAFSDGNDVWRGVEMDNYVNYDILNHFNPIS